MTTTIKPFVSNKFEVGAILEDSWGWEQTNIDFYCIIERKGDWLKVAPMKKASQSGEPLSMSTYETAVEIDQTKKPIRKKLKSFNGEERGFSFRNYTGGGWCDLWKGTASLATHYA